jgi:hypothetical protein
MQQHSEGPEVDVSSRLDDWERRTAPILTALAVAALVTLVLEAAFDAHPRAATALNYLAWATFAVDYAIRLRLAEDRWRFVRGQRGLWVYSYRRRGACSAVNGFDLSGTTRSTT